MCEGLRFMMSLGGRTSQCKETQLVQSRRRYYILRQLGVPVKDRQESERLSQVFFEPDLRQASIAVPNSLHQRAPPYRQYTAVSLR